MLRKWSILAMLIGTALVLMVVVAPAFADQCDQVKDLKIDGTKIISAESVAAGALSIPSVPAPLAPKLAGTPAFCRVKGSIQPTSDSNIGFEVWMPTSGWNGRFVQLGSGGLGGSINYAQMASELKQGSATAATDDGHQGGGTDGSWAIGHPEKVKDFGYRAVHGTNENARKIIAAYYERAAKYSYFNGCSEGGREALMEAQRFPEDFNGILAGAPAHYWTSLLAAFDWNAQALDSPASYIAEPKRRAIEEAALSACGTQDGVIDKFIQDPQACHFDPAVLLCKGAESDSCLTSPQLEALKKIYSGPKAPGSRQQISPGYEPGAEAEPGIPGISFASYIFGSGPGQSLAAMFTTSFYGGFVFNDPKWKFNELNFDKDIATTEAKVGEILNAANPDLTAFKAHGGKLLHYHGWNDGSPPPLHSVNYYQKVVEKMGGVGKAQEFYRLFMVPGMMHCGSGNGPNSFGNFLDPVPASDPEHNIFVALEDWVEKGAAPEQIIATKYDGDDPKKGVLITRPLCPYPQQAKWSGKGDSNRASNWVCRLPADAAKK